MSNEMYNVLSRVTDGLFEGKPCTSSPIADLYDLDYSSDDSMQVASVSLTLDSVVDKNGKLIIKTSISL